VKLFDYQKADSVKEAVKTSAESGEVVTALPDFRFIAGGTTLVDLMKLNVEAPSKLMDITGLPLNKLEVTSNGGLKVGALVRNSEFANHPFVKAHYAVISEAILQGASPQLRNRATTGGNLLQKTRCIYYRDKAFPCNKREPGTGCPAIEGEHRNLAIFGTSDHCIATNPSDMNVALMALDAHIELSDKDGTRLVPITEFYKLPGDTPHIETILQPGELITSVIINPPPAGSTSTYLKLRDRASYEFALSSAAVIAQVTGGRFSFLKVAMGGVGTIPWRARKVEEMLAGKEAKHETIESAAVEFLKDAKPLQQNAFKVELSKRCLVHAISTAANLV
jgi:xanthine dehydrogenase YagS FAD-binding subunit